MVIHFLNGVVQSNKVDSIFQNLTNSKSYNDLQLDSIYRGSREIENIYLTMNNIDDSVNKTIERNDESIIQYNSI